MTEKKLESYEVPRRLAETLYVVDSDWQDTKLRRRMTVMRLASGELVLHSPVRLTEADLLGQLEPLGKPAYVLVPNAFHGSEAAWYLKRYPTAKLYVPEAARARFARQAPVAGSFERDWPGALNAELRAFPLAGTRLLHETVFVHLASRTLITTDLVFNMGDVFTGVERTLMRWNRVGEFGPTQIFEKIITRDRAQVAATVRNVLALDFDRVIMSHGEILETDGRERLRAAFTQFR